MSLNSNIAIFAAAALLAGCGAMPQTSTIAAHSDRGTSWMLAEAKARDLLYLSRGPLVYVYSYPRGALLGVLSFGTDDTAGECADKAGNVFIVDGGYGAYEYAHGGISPIASLFNPSGRSVGCSVDPTTGKLAVSGGAIDEHGKRVVSIFAYNSKRGWRFAKTYSDSAMYEANLCGYDDQGNLYLDGENASGAFQLAELPKGGNTLTNITLNQSIVTGGQVQWDGEYLAIGDSGISPAVIYQFSMSGSSGTEVGSTTLAGSQSILQFWIQGKKIIAPDYRTGKGNVGFWPYPGGGHANKTIKLHYPYGATVSLGK